MSHIRDLGFTVDDNLNSNRHRPISQLASIRLSIARQLNLKMLSRDTHCCYELIVLRPTSDHCLNIVRPCVHHIIQISSIK